MRYDLLKELSERLLYFLSVDNRKIGIKDAKKRVGDVFLVTV
jgi:hypothetical protein